jgi:N-acetylglucosaminyldiphosphoundecaprenol N-acetyl-beta-D-mannosaminyltransferase
MNFETYSPPQLPLAHVPPSIFETEVPLLQPYQRTPATPDFPARFADAVSVLGVGITNITEPAAIQLLTQMLSTDDGVHRPVYYANAHTCNCASDDPTFRDVLNAAFRVFGDGTGVRWAARAQGIRMRANLNGTDLIPRLLKETAGQEFTYYLLGSDKRNLQGAIDFATVNYPGWKLVGQHHGFVHGDRAYPVIDDINRVRPHLLLVGMGNPLQEQWLHRHRAALRVRVSMGVGGLIDRWAGTLVRAAPWIRAIGFEWLDILRRQPHKWRRYVLGNPKFLTNMVRMRASDIEQTRRWANEPPLVNERQIANKNNLEAEEILSSTEQVFSGR